MTAADNANLPVVSFIIVVRNAANTISKILDDLLVQDFPKEKIEVLLVEGRSTDNTLEVLQKFTKEHSDLDVKILDNSGKTLSCGWNVALSSANGEIILRVDAHSRMAKDFIGKNVQAILSGEKIVGGATLPTMTMSDNPTPPSLTEVAERSRLGGGAANYRNVGSAGYMDTLAHAAYHRDVFKEVGGYNEHLLRNQDVEIHYRMKKAGYKFFYDPQIRSYYVPRKSIKGLMKQKYENGIWVGLILGISPKCYSLRHFIPGIFVSAIVLGLISGFLISWLPFADLMIVYGIGASFFALKSSEHYKGLKKLKCVALPFVFFLLHTAYGLGTLMGLIRLPFFLNKIKGYKVPRPIK